MRKAPGRVREPLVGGAEGIRTPDPLHAMQVRYQLRHSPNRWTGSLRSNAWNLNYTGGPM